MTVTQDEILQARKGGYRINPAGAEAKELAKYEQHPSYVTEVYGVGNPYTYRPFPKMLFRAQRNEQGKVECMRSEPSPHEFRMAFDPDAAFLRAREAAEAFTKACQTIVADDREYQRAMENGYRESPAEAIAFLEGRERAIAQEAAERTYRDRGMSEAARAEADAAEQAAAPHHLPEVKEKPKMKHKRRPLTPEQQEAARARLANARAVKAAKNQAA